MKLRLTCHSMRISIVVLVLLNIAYFIWSYSQPQTSSYVKPPPLPRDVVMLRLVSETEQDSKVLPDASEEPQQGSDTIEPDPPLDMASVETRKCYTLGPFEDVSESRRATESIEAQGLPVTQRTIKAQIPKGYWVYLPPQSDYGKAKKVSTQLASKGVKEYYIIRKGNYNNAISLGLYNDEIYSHRRMSRIEKLGFNPVIKAQFREKDLYWLDYNEVGSNSLSTEFWESIADTAGSLQRISKDCELS